MTTRGWGGDRSRGSVPALALKSAQIVKLSTSVFFFFFPFLKSSLIGKDPGPSARMDPCLQTRGAAGGGRGPCRPGTRHSGPCAWRGRSGAQRRGVPFRGPFPASERGLGCSRALSGIQPKLSLSSRSPSQPALPPRAPLIAPQSRAPGQAQASARAWGRAWGRGALGAAATGTGTGTAGDRDSRMKTRSAPASAYLRGLAWARLPTSPRSLRQGWGSLEGKATEALLPPCV